LKRVNERCGVAMPPPPIPHGGGVGNNLQTFVAHGANVKCLTFSPKRTFLATGGDDRHVNIWKIGKTNYINHLSGSSSAIEAVAFEGEDRTVVGGSATGSLKLWDLATGKPVRSLSGHKANIRSLDFHPYGEFIASGSLDTVLKVWDIRRKGCIQQYKGHGDAINTIKFSPDGRWVISGSEDSVVKLWDLTAGKPIKELKLHTGAITSLEFHPNEFLLATGSADRTVRWWDLETFQCVSESQVEASRVRSIAFDENGSCLYSAAQDSLRVHRWEPWECYDRKPVPWGKVFEVAVTADKILAGSINQQQVSIWEVPVDQLNRAPGRPAEDPVRVPSVGRVASVDPPTPNSSAPPPYMERSPQQVQAAAPAQAQVQPVHEEQQPREVKPVVVAAPPPAVTADSVAAAPPAQAGNLPAGAVRAVKDASRPSALSANRAVREERPISGSGARVGSPAVRAGSGGADAATPGGRGTPVIPAQRDKPVGLNLDAFLPPSTAPTGGDHGPDDTEILESIETGHGSMLKVLQLRLRNTQVVRRRWESGDHKAAVETLVDLADQAVLVDVLGIMVNKTKLWTLEVSATLMPQVEALLGYVLLPRRLCRPTSHEVPEVRGLSRWGVSGCSRGSANLVV